MLEARSFEESLDKARKILSERGAIYKGEYVIRDVVYSLKDKSKSLADEFLRLRIISKNIWDEKAVVVAIKKTDVKEIGKLSNIPLKMQFDTEEEARNYIGENLFDKYEFSYQFDRTGWQYNLGADQVDLEDIEGHYSIEIKSSTEDGLRELKNLFQLGETIKGPSVVKVKELLNR